MTQQTSAQLRVAILISTLNGAKFLQDWLDSLTAQTHSDWVLYWRDDGSADDTVNIMRAFERGPGAGRFVAVESSVRQGIPASFLTLLEAAAAGTADIVAFADQDDIWLPQKLERGVNAISAVDRARPVLYCARQILVDDQLNRIGFSNPLRKNTEFPAALTQNVATGCTVLMNQRAARLVAGSVAPASTLHDWWSYLVVSASGGTVLADAHSVVLYRQHGGNFVGAPTSRRRRAIAALRRGPDVFMNVLRQHVAALAAQPNLLDDSARRQVGLIDDALKGRGLQRLRALGMPGLRRQTFLETVLFRIWFLIG